jgi:pre-mRNA-processing factor 6
MYDDDDDEADRIWAAIDERMKHRKKKKKRRKRTGLGGELDDGGGGSKEDEYDDEEDDQEGGGESVGKTTTNIAAQFRSLKQELASVSEQEWNDIPDASKGDASLRHKLAHAKRKSMNNAVPVSDSLLEHRSHLNRDATASTAAAASALSKNLVADDLDSGGISTSIRGLSGLSAAREAVLGRSLDRMMIPGGGGGVSAGGTTTTAIVGAVAASNRVDAEGYLTSLAATTSTATTTFGGAAAAQHTVADLNKARLLLESVRETNPHHGSGWIASARVEEAAGNTLRARKIIQDATEACPDQVDVWLEAARLHPPDHAKRILATAVRHLPHAVPLFLHAAKLEPSPANQREVLRKGLTVNPGSLTLWKAAIELEDDDASALTLLRVAVEHVPHSVELWLALAKLETYENAQKVLNKARKCLPKERAIWMAAAKLEESQQHPEMVDKIVGRAVSSLNNSTSSSRKEADASGGGDANGGGGGNDQVVITREQWLQEAMSAETSGHTLTASAIVKHTIRYQVEDEDRQLVWADEARSALASRFPHTARAILSQALQVFPTRRGLWRQAVDLEREHGTFSSLDQVLEAACERLPTAELFWLLRAKEQWIAGHVDAARSVLTRAFAANPESQEIWLAAAKLECENGEIERARVLLSRARERASSERVYMKSALLEREQKKPAAALELIEGGIKLYPKFAKLYMMGGQICSSDLAPRSAKTLERARRFYQRGLEQCPDSVVLWILASRLEEVAWMYRRDNFSSEDSTQGVAKSSAHSSDAALCFNKARGILDLGRLKNPKNPQLWLESTRLERRAGNIRLAETFLAKALQECPDSGLLLAEDIYSCPRVKKKSKSSHAIQRNPEDPLIICAVATFFASERKADKARKWFSRAVVLNPDDGDSWARYYAFELSVDDVGNGNDDANNNHRHDVKQRCVFASPKHGEIWTSISKEMSNRGKGVEAILELAAAKVQEINHQYQDFLISNAG